MNTSAIKFMAKIKELNKDADLAEIETQIKRLSEVGEGEEFDTLNDTISTNLAIEIADAVSKSVESRIDDLYQSLLKSIPKGPDGDMVGDIADGILIDIKSGKYKTIQEAIDRMYDDYYNDIGDYLMKHSSA